MLFRSPPGGLFTRDNGTERKINLLLIYINWLAAFTLLRLNPAILLIHSQEGLSGGSFKQNDRHSRSRKFHFENELHKRA